MTGLADVAAPAVKNVVAVFKLAHVETPLSLATLAPALRNATYMPSRMNAAILRVPGTTAMLFASGTVTLTGAKSEPAARAAADAVAAEVARALRARVGVQGYGVRNIVCSWSVGYRVRLEGVASECFLDASYEPELFPGLRLKMVVRSGEDGEGKVTAQIFSSGKVVFLGAKSFEVVRTAADVLKLDILPQHMFVMQP
jgi:transcription initiation factor TFIID TATA-box-binding protein